MDGDDYGQHGHPVLTGLAVAVTFAVARRNARAYLDVNATPGAADRFFRKARRCLLSAAAEFTLLLVLAAFASYGSLAAGIGIAISAGIIAAALILAPAMLLFYYAGQHLQNVGRARGWLR